MVEIHDASIGGLIRKNDPLQTHHQTAVRACHTYYMNICRHTPKPYEHPPPLVALDTYPAQPATHTHLHPRTAAGAMTIYVL